MGKPSIKRLMCPGEHVPKILLFYHEEKDGPPKKFWVHCGNKKCNKWVQIRFGSNGGIQVKQMPDDTWFHGERSPYLLVDEHA